MTSPERPMSASQEMSPRRPTWFVLSLKGVALFFIVGFWYVWLVQLAFPFGGGEGHWVMNRIAPLRLRDGLFLGGLYAGAGISLGIVLLARRVWATIGIGLLSPFILTAIASALHVTSPVPADDSAMQWLEWSAFTVLPLLGAAFIAERCRRGVHWMAVAILVWWPAALHLPAYLLAVSLSPGFRLGIGVMWLAGGLAVLAISVVGASRTQ